MLSKIDLGLIYFNPQNIAKRMALEYVQTQDEPQETETETQNEEP